ncbi:MAG: large subunit ribosomal protein L20 [Puniceicoccaceae bacterium 5H]|nr:MAG: large subunit ribosomal protein L20 [Puniceicoccaceae bacterium 5H]
MPKARNVAATRKRHQRKLKQAKGYFGNASRLYRYAKQAVDRAGQYSYRDRRVKKREFRSLWIVRINAACREEGINYSRFMAGLKALNIEMDRKALSEMAIHDEAAFKALVVKAKEAVQTAA